MKNTAILLVDCPDQKGIVAAVSDFLYHHNHNANILHADQHQDGDLGLFLTRVEWKLEDFGLPIADEEAFHRPRGAGARGPLAHRASHTGLREEDGRIGLSWWLLASADGTVSTAVHVLFWKEGRAVFNFERRDGTFRALFSCRP
jgi:hypothetical protein